MKIQDNYLWRKGAQRALLVVTLGVFVVISGCNIFGFLASPGPFEKKVPPQYNLKENQDRKVLVWLELPHSSNADYDVREKLTAAFKLYLTKDVKIIPENILWHEAGPNDDFSLSPMKAAQERGVGYLLLVQVDDYELIPLNVRKYYAGRMVSHAVLMDADLGMTVWPKDESAKVIEVGVDLETDGREAALKRLVSATAHCTLRYLYPCEKLKFKISDEKLSIQEAYDMETF